jgi:hypothetical protein
LIGISPARVSGSNDYLNKDVPIYVPTYNSDTPTRSTWVATTSTAKNWTTWGSNTSAPSDIPYMDPMDYAEFVPSTTNSREAILFLRTLLPDMRMGRLICWMLLPARTAVAQSMVRLRIGRWGI